MRTYSSLKKIKQGKYVYIYLYFKKLDNIIRINTKNEFIPKCMNRDLTYNSKMVNYEDLNTKTYELQQKVDDYIRYKLRSGSINTLSQKWKKRSKNSVIGGAN